MSDPKPLEHWLEAAVQSATEVAGSALALEALAAARSEQLVDQQSGAYIPLLAEGDSVYLGLLSTDEGLSTLTRALLGMEPPEPTPGERDVVDAVSEIANMIGGGVQRRLSEPGFAVDLGLPIFVKGEVMLEDQATASARLAVGEAAIEIVILHGGHRQELGAR